MDKCRQLKEEGFLKMKKHVKYSLYLLNYTSKTQYQQKWCKELIHTRGMVVDEDGQIIARPLTKFFNLTEIKRERNQLALRKSGRFLTKNLGYLVFFPHRTTHFEACGSFYSAQNHFETHQLNNTKYILKMCEGTFWYLTYTSFVALVALT